MSLPLLQCPYLKTQRCDVCVNHQLTNVEQLQLKTNRLAEQIGFDAVQIVQHPGVAERFRDKMKLQISGSLESLEHLRLGFLDPTELIVKTDLTHCPLHHPFLEELIPLIKQFLFSSKATPYDIAQKTGEAKGVIAFYSPTTKSSYLRLVMRSKESLDRLRKNLDLLARVDVISVNIQPTPHALLEGEEEIFLKGDSIKHRFHSCELYLSPRGFVQTNTTMAEKLYLRASELAQKYQASKALDLYCGHGPFSFFLHSKSISCTGVEVNSQAVEFAQKSVRDFYPSGPALAFLQARSSEVRDLVKQVSPDLIVVNPPRAGLRDGVDLLKQSHARLVLYSSCSSETLALDLTGLKEHYQIREVEIFDMFPHSAHFETLVLLERNS